MGIMFSFDRVTGKPLYGDAAAASPARVPGIQDRVGTVWAEIREDR
jgi:hypothetical protein